MLGESKTMKARGFNKMYEATTRINRIIDKTSKFSESRIKPLPLSKYMDETWTKTSPLSNKNVKQDTDKEK